MIISFAPIYCSRCGLRVGTEHDVWGPMTAGFYVARAWRAFCDPHDVYVCDRCMWADRRYVRVYGKVEPRTPPPRTVQEAFETLAEAWRELLRQLGWYRLFPHPPRRE